MEYLLFFHKVDGLGRIVVVYSCSSFQQFRRRNVRPSESTKICRSCGNTIRNQKEQHLSYFQGHSGPIYSLSFSCEKRLLLSGSRDSTIRLWNLEMSRNLVVYRSMAPVWQVQFCSRGYYFAASTADQTVSLWTTDRLKPLRFVENLIYACINHYCKIYRSLTISNRCPLTTNKHEHGPANLFSFFIQK